VNVIKTKLSPILQAKAGAKTLAGCSALMLALGAAGSAYAAPVLYKDKAAFDAAVAGIANTDVSVQNFDGIAAGTTFASGAAIGGLNLTYTLGDTTVGDAIDPAAGIRDIGGTSGANTLAYEYAGAFGGFTLGDTLNFGFTVPTYAFGFYLVLGDINFDFLADDAILSFGGATLSVADADVATSVNGTPALFLGIVDTAQKYSSASVVFNTPLELDDLITVTDKVTNPPNPLPVPGTLLLVLLGGTMLSAAKRLGRKLSGQA